MTAAGLQLVSLGAGLGGFLWLGSILLLRARRLRMEPALPTATALTALWLGTAMVAALLTSPLLGMVAQALEAAAYGGWLWLLAQVLGLGRGSAAMPGYRGPLVITAAGITMVVLLLVAFVVLVTTSGPGQSLVYAAIMGKAALALLGLVMVEQVARNTRRGHQWNLKFLSLALATVFGYAFVLYGEALPFNRVNPVLAAPQGLIVALAAPLLAIAVRRNPDGTLAVNVSQELVFRAGVLAAAGVYLLLIAAAATYLQAVGGEWGAALAVVLTVTGALSLILALGSSRVRGRLRRMLQRHVYRDRFDYRDEWDRVTRELAGSGTAASNGADSLGQRAIHALAHVTQSTEGALWALSASGTLVPAARVKAEWHEPLSAATAAALARHFAADPDVVDLAGRHNLPAELLELNQARFVVPLTIGDRLYGIVVLAEARAPTRLGFETQRLLQLIAREAAGFLALQQADHDLDAARALQAVNQLSAFVVHDLKNVTSQLELMLGNADRHRSNPAFVDDLLATAQSSAARLQGLLGKLREAGDGQTCAATSTGPADMVDLAVLTARIVGQHGERRPCPVLHGADSAVLVRADAEPLGAALGHLLDNACEAAGNGGRVTVNIDCTDRFAAISIEDDGPGMSRAFIEHELFAPLVTTKGRAGIGIGAYQAREHARQLGGDLSVRSTPGQGSRFTLHLPLAHTAGQAPARSAASGDWPTHHQENRHERTATAHH